MKNIKKMKACFLLSASCLFLLTACQTGQSTSQTTLDKNAALTETTTENAESEAESISEIASETTEISTEAETETETETIRNLTINIVNLCGVDIGMFSVIDPVSKEQFNVDSLSDQESITLSVSWPESVTDFQWALYNQKGELCIEGKTDISSASTSATLLLKGDGNVTDVEESFN